MKFFIVLALFATVALAGPVSTDSKTAYITRYDNNIEVEKYDFNVETSDGKTAQESGVLKNVGTEQEAIEVRGSFAYVAPNGVTYSVTYIANEGGFQPSAAHIPQ